MASAVVIFFYFGTRRDRKLVVLDSSCHGNLGDRATPGIFVWWGTEGFFEPLTYPNLFFLTSNWQGKGFSNFK